jgi:hypothetical protein
MAEMLPWRSEGYSGRAPGTIKAGTVALAIGTISHHEMKVGVGKYE